MNRMALSLTIITAFCFCGTAQPPRGPTKTPSGPVRPKPAPAIPINPNPSGGTVPRLPPLPFVSSPDEAKSAPAAPTPSPAIPPLPAADRDGSIYLDKLRLHVTLNKSGVVQVVKADGRSPLYVLVARGSGLSTEVFVPGDTIYGFGGNAVTSISELQQLSQQPGWHYVEGICNGTNRGKAYIGRIYIGER